MSGILVATALAAGWRTRSLAAETCRFTGTTDYAGHVSLVTTATSANDTTQVDVALRFEATTGLWLHLHYLFEEISQWRHGVLQRLDANTRYIFAGHLVRQQWDEFKASGPGLQGYRIEGKRPAEFAQQFPRFAQHWDPAVFGLPWLNDFAAAAPVRRQDLDLPKMPASTPVQSPFALAFYWIRFLHQGVQHQPVFLPGFKADKMADLAIHAGPAGSGRRWKADLHHSWLSAVPPSTATAQISEDGHLDLLSFELHGSAGSAHGILHAAGCVGGLAP